MEVKTVIQWLLDEGYMVLVNNKLVPTKKLNDVLGTVETVVVENKPINPPSISRQLTQDHKKEIWNKFCIDADIPHRVTAPDGGRYTVRQYSPNAVNELIKIINTPGIDYTRLTESTKNYYKTVTYKHLLMNYLSRDIWRGEYENWNQPTTKTNSWED